MADLKISQLTGATTPLAGTEVLPIVQNSTTKKVAVSDLTTGRAVSAASLALTSSPLPATSGGTGANSLFTVNGVTYASSTSVLATGTDFVFDGANVGVGITPTAWDSSVFKAIQVGKGGAIFGDVRNAQAGNVGFSSNVYYGSGAFRYINTNYAGQYFIAADNGVHTWSTASSGTAGTAATLDTAMTLDPSTNNLTISLGNITQGTAAKGVNFTANTPAAGMTSQLLNWYEEGTWTPTVAPTSGAYATVSVAQGSYTRIGRQVTLRFNFIVSDKGTGSGGFVISGLPFTANGSSYAGSAFNSSTAVSTVLYGVNMTTQFEGYKYDGTDPVVVNQEHIGVITYFV